MFSAVMVFLFLFCSTGGSLWAKGEPQLVFETEGKSNVTDGNFANGRIRAVNYAFKDALALALQEVLGESSYRRKRKMLEAMLREPEKYIKRYRFLEMHDSVVEQISRVKLEVVFYPQAINRELSTLGILASLVKPNTALVLINEKSLSVEVPPDFWEYVPISEVAMLQNFLTSGVNVINREKISERVDEGEVYDAIQGDLDAAVDIGLKAKVDIVIVGTAVTTRLGDKNAEGLVTIQANLTLRAVSTTQSTVIAARSDFATVQAEEEFKGELEAFQVVGKKMAGFFLETMNRYWAPKPEPVPGMEIDEPVTDGDDTVEPAPPPPPNSTPSMMEDL
jgi:hypothetical protein